jgi:hypothetical protein
VEHGAGSPDRSMRARRDTRAVVRNGKGSVWADPIGCRDSDLHLLWPFPANGPELAHPLRRAGTKEVDVGRTVGGQSRRQAKPTPADASPAGMCLHRATSG